MILDSSVFPLSGGGSVANNTLLLLRPIDGKIIDLVTGASPTEMYFVSATPGQNGKVEISTDTFKFDKSIYLYRSILNTLTTHFYDSDFTIECWYRMLEGSISSDFNSLFARGDTTGTSVKSTIYLGYSSSNFGVGLGNQSGDTSYDSFSGTAPPIILNQFNHFALVRHSNVIKVYLNGVKRLETTTLPNLFNVNNATVSKMSSGLSLGGGWFAVNLALLNTRSRNGWYEEIRVSNIARYTTDFTPPTSQFVLD